MTKIRKGVAVAATLTAILMLSGCSVTPRSEALKTPGSVVELTNEGIGVSSTWGYVAESGELIEMENCAKPSLIKRSWCENEDGTYRFEWSSSKGNAVAGTVSMNGETVQRVTCGFDAEDFWGVLSVCVPMR